jgi:hypothetical protein
MPSVRFTLDETVAIVEDLVRSPMAFDTTIAKSTPT